MRQLGSRACVVLGVLALLVPGFAGVAAANDRGAAAPRTSAGDWAWVVARHPTTSDYTPGPLDRGNSDGGVNSVHRVRVGEYTVTLPLLASDLGSVFVTPIAAVLRICNVIGWGPVGTDEVAQVRCFDGTGARADTKFSLDYLVGRNLWSYSLGYVLANRPLAAGYLPAGAYRFNSSGNANTIARSGVGTYSVTFGGLAGASGGGVQVSAFGPHPATCRSTVWGGSPDVVVGVLCRDLHGAPVDSRFTAAFFIDVGLRGLQDAPAAYLWADQKHDPGYFPLGTYSWTSWGTASAINRTGRGVYTVYLNDLAGTGGSAQVTSDGSSAKHCQLRNIKRQGSTQQIGVSCFSTTGAPADDTFDVAYTQ
jgi:hypothetical protein